MKNNLRNQYKSDFSQLRKIINSWELYDFVSSDEFDSLNNKILSHLYKDSDSDKLSRIIQSELSSNYGLFYNEFDSQKLSKEVLEWWESKF